MTSQFPLGLFIVRCPPPTIGDRTVQLQAQAPAGATESCWDGTGIGPMKPTYDANAEIALAEVDVEFLKEGLSSRAKVLLDLSPVPDIRFEVLHDSPAIHSPLVDGLIQNEPVVIRLSPGIQVEVMPYGTSLIPVDGSVIGLDTGEPLHSVQFGLINFPDFLKQGSVDTFISDDGRKGLQVSNAVQLSGPPWLVEIRAVDNIRQVRSTLSQRQGFGLTHWGCIKRSDGKPFSKDSVQSMIEALILFCSFARGVYCGLTLIKGTNQSGEPAWERWGVSKVEPWKACRSWFDTRNGQIPEDVFPGFWAQYQRFQRNSRTRVALEWYLESNAQKALHSSIVLSRVALERLSFLQVGSKLAAGQNGRKSRETEGEWIAVERSHPGLAAVRTPTTASTAAFKSSGDSRPDNGALVLAPRFSRPRIFQTPTFRGGLPCALRAERRTVSSFPQCMTRGPAAIPPSSRVFSIPSRNGGSPQ